MSVRSAQRGATLVEFLIVLPVLLGLTLGALQLALIYEAKISVNYATLMAARAGAVSSADPRAMGEAFTAALSPLRSGKQPSENDLDNTILRVLNPTREAFVDHAQVIEGRVSIPNSRLHVRDPDPATLSGVNIQDANLLKVMVLYGFKLHVPLVRESLLTLASVGASSDELQLLQAGRLPVLATATVRMQSDAIESSAVLSRNEVDSLVRR